MFWYCFCEGKRLIFLIIKFHIDFYGAYLNLRYWHELFLVIRLISILRIVCSSVSIKAFQDCVCMSKWPSTTLDARYLYVICQRDSAHLFTVSAYTDKVDPAHIKRWSRGCLQIFSSEKLPRIWINTILARRPDSRFCCVSWRMLCVLTPNYKSPIWASYSFSALVPCCPLARIDQCHPLKHYDNRPYLELDLLP